MRTRNRNDSQYTEIEGAFRVRACMNGVQGAVGGGGVAEAVEIVGVVLQGAVVVPRGDRDGAEAERQPHVVVGDGVRRRVHLRDAPRLTPC